MAPPLTDVVRKAAKPGIWAVGVNLARAGAVALESKKKGELELRVKAPGRVVALTVVLYPDDEAWDCDCGGRVDPCEHVVAAAIAVGQAEQPGGAPAAEPTSPGASPDASSSSSSSSPDAPRPPQRSLQPRWSRVVYRFRRAEGGLAVERFLAHPDGNEEPLVGSVASMVAKPLQGAQLQVEQFDLAADRLLDRPTRGPLPPEKLAALLKTLEGARRVLLDGRPIAISDEVVLPTATVVDHSGRVVLTIAAKDVDEVLAIGVARCGDALARLGETALAGPRFEKLPMTKTFGSEQLGELTTKILPDLARRIPVDVKSKKLPRVDPTLVPRVLFDLIQLDSGVSIMPTVVYGAPPSVRIDAGKMVHLKGPVPVRDEPAEQRLVHSLRDELNFAVGRRVTVPVNEVPKLAERLRRFGGGLAGDAAALVRSDAKLVPTLRVESTATSTGVPQVRFDFDFSIDESGTSKGNVEAAAVVRAWSEGQSLVPLLGGGFAPIPREWLEANGALVAGLLAARIDDGRLDNAALPELKALCDALDQPPPPAFAQLAPLWQGFERIPEATLPDDVTATLRPYQRAGVSWLAFLRSAGLGGVLADDMGLGKTLQTICVLQKGSLVVMPTSVLPNWQTELARFRPSLKVGVYHGPGRAFQEDVDVTLTTYAILRLDAQQLAARTWDTVVLDEAQAIKNPESQVARAAFALQAVFRVALSGTPVENRLEELWSVLHFASPGLLGGRRDFVERYARPVADGRKDAADKLRRRIKPFVLRRLKKDVAPELPPRTESVMHVVLDDRERAVYDAVLAATRAEVVALLQSGGGVMKALEALLRLRQAACHPSLVPGQAPQRSSSKIDALVDALSTAVSEGHKALVFSQWTSLLDLLEPMLKSADIGFSRLDGSTTNRGEITTEFQKDKGPPVLIMSLKAGGTGLNLTAADHVFLMDPWWNPAAEAQAADRAHRIGQERPVNVYRLVAQGTVEERILLLQDKKRALFEAALGDAAAGAAITREDLLSLFD